jgi:hypothetical protein
MLFIGLPLVRRFENHRAQTDSVANKSARKAKEPDLVSSRRGNLRVYASKNPCIMSRGSAKALLAKRGCRWRVSTSANLRKNLENSQNVESENLAGTKLVFVHDDMHFFVFFCMERCENFIVQFGFLQENSFRSVTFVPSLAYQLGCVVKSIFQQVRKCVGFGVNKEGWPLGQGHQKQQSPRTRASPP